MILQGEGLCIPVDTCREEFPCTWPDDWRLSSVSGGGEDHAGLKMGIERPDKG